MSPSAESNRVLHITKVARHLLRFRGLRAPCESRTRFSCLEGKVLTDRTTVQTERPAGVEPALLPWQGSMQPQTSWAQSPRPEVVASNPPELWTIPLVRPSRLLRLPITRFAADTEHKQGREYLNSTAYLPTSTGIRGHGQNCTGALSDLQSDALLSWLRGRTEETERVERSEHRGSAV